MPAPLNSDADSAADAIDTVDAIDTADAVETADVTTVDGEPAADALDPADADDAPLNRAERRAKGKGGKQPQAVGKIQPGKTNLNHGPRQYANRRSG